MTTLKNIHNTIKDFMFYHHDRDIAKTVSIKVSTSSSYDFEVVLSYDNIYFHNIEKDLLGLRSALDNYADCSTARVRHSGSNVTLSLLDMSTRAKHISSLVY